MSIIQISKIQVRSGNLVDLPQLDEAEFGWATDSKKLYIGKTTPNENIEVLTSYSQINFSQINGSAGNLNIDGNTLANGQPLIYDGSNWVNRGGDVGGLITLGDVSNVKITGGAIGYVLQTDGLGNLSWTPKSIITAYIQNVSKANPAVVTTVDDNFFIEGLKITVTNSQGMTQLNGNTYYVDVLTSNTFALYSDSGLTTPVNSTGYTAYAYTSVTGTTISTNVIDVGNAALLTVNSPVRFLGDLTTSGLENDFTYYIKARNTGANTITVSDTLYANGVAGNVVPLTTTTGLTANVYQEGGRAISSVTGSATAAGGSNTTIQVNNNNLLGGDTDFTFDFGAATKVMALNGNANVGNLNANGVVTSTRFISNIATGTTPLQVVSTTRVSNLNVAYSNVSDFGVVTTQTTGTFYPILASGNTTANYALASNANLSFNAATGNLTTGLLNVVGNANVGGNLGVAGAATIVGNASAGNISTAGVLSVTGNANVGNLGAGAGLFTANVTSNNIIANNAANVGANLNVTGVALLGANANVTGNLNVTANANVTGRMNVTGNALFSGTATVTGNLSSGNASLGNLATANFFSGDGSLLTNISVMGGTFIQNGTSNLVVDSSANVRTSVAGTANVLVVYSNGIQVTGNANATAFNGGLYKNGTSNVTIASGGNISLFTAGNATAQLIASSTGVNVAGTANILGVANVVALNSSGKATLAGNSSVFAALITSATEVANIQATAATGTINFDLTSQGILNYTTNASANWTMNFRASSGTTLNSALGVGETVTCVFLAKQGTTAYFANVHQIDGSNVTPLWQGGTAPTSGDANSVDAYTYTIMKTSGAPAYTVLASITKFA